jgi:glycerophosphoryl diester phosphodiesterase
MLLTAMTADARPPRAYPHEDGGKPLVIAHRGASGYLPEHTLAAYSVAILQGADFIEPDLVMTKDGHLIARHDNVLNLTTDVARRPDFADRRTTKVVDGVTVTGWFSEDFTLTEIKQLRAIERIPDVRPANARFDGQFQVPTLQEIIDLVKSHERALGRRIGLYPETKHPTYFQRLGLPMEEPLVEMLCRNGYEEAPERVFIQSFEVGNLRKLDSMTPIPLVQLLGREGKPYDVEAERGALTYDQMATPQGLADIATYADGVGPEKYHFILAPDVEGRLDPANATDFVKNAHAVGLKVHPYTFRAENRFLPASLRSSDDPNALGDGEGEIAAFLATGVDGFFTDQADAGVRARDAFATGNR